MAAPAPVEQSSLIDSVGAGLHGREGFGFRLPQISERPGRPHLEPEDGLPFAVEAFQTAPLVLDALLLQQIKLWVLVYRPRPVVSCGTELQGRQMLARQVADEVGGA